MYLKEWKALKRQVETIEISSLEELYLIQFHQLLIAGEDHRFMHHNGVDLIALCRATWKTLFCNKREGGSTIAMQLVRVLTGKYEKTLSRKILEIYLAIRITNYLPRNKIISMYLSLAYFGWKMDGLKEAINQLGLVHNDLSLRDIASIIARLKYPEPKYFSKEKEHLIMMRTNHILFRYEKLHIGKSYGSL
ncbi:biosynthetic peptidoglycan transglycosylase [Sulfurovum sp.]|uniref:biosynthetic peptidoglycan transglycosylase n=1 Tax=Sulfurovum sp. TaxID=1969726 RepID=UPI002867F8B4|nr:biosynthetic peptidoglycan transglycosylase [Sulfurovum sp.]